MPKSQILIVEDNILVSRAVKDILEDAGYKADVADNGKIAEKMLAAGDYRLVLLDMMLPDISGEKLLKKWEKYVDINIIVMTAYGEVTNAVECLKNGAYDFLVKPVDKDLLLKTIRNAMKQIQLEAKVTELATGKKGSKKKVARPGGLVFGSEAMRRTMEISELVAKSDFSSLLITGESGSGKGMLSKAIHQLGPRADKVFVEVNCSALPANLIESELFGHKKGAFTDAKEDKPGLFELADGGTLFLDEIGDMDVTLQSKLLKAIEEKQFRRIGGTKNIKVDVAIIAATNASLEQDIKDGLFRLDLYYRLNVVPIKLAPLRERYDDIPVLCEFFIEVFSKKFSKRIKGFTDDAFEQMKAYNWPGNVRELANVVERGCILAQGEFIDSDLLMLDQNSVLNTLSGSTVEAQSAAVKKEVLTLSEAEKSAIESALTKTDGNKNEAAKLLGVHRTTLYKKIDEYEILV